MEQAAVSLDRFPIGDVWSVRIQRGWCILNAEDQTKRVKTLEHSNRSRNASRNVSVFQNFQSLMPSLDDVSVPQFVPTPHRLSSMLETAFTIVQCTSTDATRVSVQISLANPRKTMALISVPICKIVRQTPKADQLERVSAANFPSWNIQNAESVTERAWTHRQAA